jgi:RNA binding exosome subunit
MTRKINAKIEMILHATEDYQKISEALYDMFVIDRDKITVQRLSGHFGNPILMLYVEMKKKTAEIFLKKLVSVIPKTQFTHILEDLEERIHDSTLYLRFSKQKFIKKILTLEEKDPIKISIYTPVYVKKELHSTYRKLLGTR